MSDIGDPFQLELLLSRAAGCGYTLAAMLAALLAAIGVAKLSGKGESIVGPGLVALGLGIAAGAAALGDVIDFLELEPIASTLGFLATRLVNLCAFLAVLVGIAITAPRTLGSGAR